MTAPPFGYAARLAAQTLDGRWLRAAGAIFFWGLATAGFLWWNGLADPQEAPKQAMLSFALAFAGGCSVPLLWRTATARPFPWFVNAGLAGLALSGGISFVAAPDRWLAFFGSAGSVSGSFLTLLLGMAGFALAGTLAQFGWKPSFVGARVALVALALFALAQRFGWVDFSPGGPAARLFTPFGHERAFAWLVACFVLAAVAEEGLGLPTTLTGLWTRRLSVLFGAAYLLFVDDAAVWLAWIVAVVGITVLEKRRFWQEKTRAAFLGLAFAFGIFGLVVQVPQPAQRPALAVLSDEQSRQAVQAAWQPGMRWFGAGPGQWASVFERIRPAALNAGALAAVRFDAGGRFFWTVSLQQGLVGIVAWAVFLLVVGIRVIQRVRADRDQWPTVVALAVAIVAWVFLQPPVWGVVWPLALAGWLSAGSFRPSVKEKRWWCLALAMLVLPIALSLPWGARRLWADRAAWRAERAATAEGRRALALTAFQRFPALPEYAVLAGAAETDWLQERLRQGGSLDGIGPALSAAVARSQQATARWPFEAAAWLVQGRLYQALMPAAQGADQFAIRAYQEGLRRAPRHPGFPFGIAQVFLWRAQTFGQQAAGADAVQGKALAEARLEQLRLAAQWFKRALDQKPDDLSLRYAYAVTLAQAGDVAGALSLFQAFVAAEPARTDLRLEYATLLEAAGQRPEAIRLAEGIGSQDPAFLQAQRLLAGWYEAEQRWTEAVAALRQFPVAEQATAAFRQRLNRLQSKGRTSAAR